VLAVAMLVDRRKRLLREEGQAAAAFEAALDDHVTVPDVAHGPLVGARIHRFPLRRALGCAPHGDGGAHKGRRPLLERVVRKTGLLRMILLPA
jgi:hypothetical protein